MKLKYACADAGQYGLNVSPESYTDSGFRLIRTSDIGADGLSSDAVYVAGPQDPRHQIAKGDLLLSRAGTIGRAFEVPASMNGQTFAGFLIRFRPRDDWSSRFLFYVTQAHPFQDQVSARAVRSTIQNFNAERYANIEIPEVSREEQHRVAGFLDSQVAYIDRMNRARLEQVRLSDGLLASASEVAFKLITHAPRVPIRWLMSYFQDGDWIETPYITDQGVRLIQTGNVGVGEFREQGNRYISEETFSALKCKPVYPDDLLISRLGHPAARACRAPDLASRMVTSVDVVISRPDAAQANSEFLLEYLSSPQHLADSGELARGATLQRLSRTQVGHIRIPIPDMSTQKHVARSMQDARRARTERNSDLTQAISQLTEYKQSLITAAVSGEFDVTTASGRGAPT